MRSSPQALVFRALVIAALVGLSGCGPSSAPSKASASAPAPAPLSPAEIVDKDMRCGAVLTYMIMFGDPETSKVADTTMAKYAPLYDADLAAAGLTQAEVDQRRKPEILKDFYSNFETGADGPDMSRPVAGAQERLVRQYADCVTYVLDRSGG